MNTKRIDPDLVPSRSLANGAKIPAIGLGTFGSDSVSAEAVAQSVRKAAELGYRHFDCASVYGNQKEIGNALQDIMASGIKRQELWVNGKLWNDKHSPEDVIPNLKKTLAELKLDYLDLFLIHWPFPNHHAPGVNVASRDSNAKPYIHKDYMKTWQELEKLVDMGLVKNIGTSNMSIAKLKLLLKDCRIKPVANELEMHPHFQQNELFEFLRANDIQAIAFSPLGSPNRPLRDRTPEDSSALEDPVIIRIAERLEIHPAEVCIKWAVQRGQIPIPFSSNIKNIFSNLKAAVSEPLSRQDMEDIASIDKNCRLIKGQVFLWKEGQDWRDLWDEDGVIAQ